MENERKLRKIDWYRSPVERDLLAALNQRSDWKGLRQTLGHLGILLVTGSAAWYASTQGLWLLFGLVLFLHGTVYAFLLNGFHELCHSSVFKSKNINHFFLYLFSFLGSFNPVFFWASHQEHHKYTLHPPDDLEVVLPIELTLQSFLSTALVNPWGFVKRLIGVTKLSFGRIEGKWENILFPASNPAQRQRLIGWARVLLIGHGLLTGVSLYFGAWQLPVLITLAPFYGGCLLYLCNNTQHVGLQDYVPDFRLCTRTIRLHPVVQFLYWHMNFHTEHHMYAAVPCYHLQTLHRAIEHDLPPTPVGLYATWREIIGILRRQKAEPTYQFVPEVPGRPVGYEQSRAIAA